MNIQKYTYRLNASKLTPVNPDNIDSIALHHMAHATAGINDVTGWHMDENLWDWIGYGYWIGFDGTVHECRGYKHLNAGVADNNRHIVSVGFQGDYSKNVQMPDKQFNSGIEVIRYLKSKLPNVRTIEGHKHWNNTTCPGMYFPLVKMIQGVEVINVKIEEAKQILLEEKVINSPDYWQKTLDTVKNQEQLFINVATKIKELKALAK